MPTLAELLFDAGRRLMDKVGLPLAFINLSGGVGIPYRPEQPAPDIAAIGEGVRLAYEKVFTANGVQGVAIKTELGRYMTGPHGWLVTHATSHKDTYKHYIGLDACAANLMRPAMYGAYHHITVVGKGDAALRSPLRCHRQLCAKTTTSSPSTGCCPRLTWAILWCIHDTGAHGFSMGYNYNGRLRSRGGTLPGGRHLPAHPPGRNPPGLFCHPGY